MKVITYHETGMNHSMKNKPCQDRFLAGCVEGGQISAVADGHGSVTYSRAGLGARMACFAAVKVLRAAYEKGAMENGGFDFSEGNATKLGQEIKSYFDRLVEKHLTLHPLTVDEKERLKGSSESYVYGTTLMCSVLGENGQCIILKVGDGETHAVNARGEFLPLFPDYVHLDSGETASMVQENVTFEVVVVKEPVALLLHFTDGYVYEGEYPYYLMECVLEDSSVMDSELTREHTERSAEEDACGGMQKKKLASAAMRGMNGDDSTILLMLNEDFCTESFSEQLSQKLLRHGRLLDIKEYCRQAAGEKQYLTLGMQKLNRLKAENEEWANDEEVLELQRNISEHFRRWTGLLMHIEELEKLVGLSEKSSESDGAENYRPVAEAV